MQQVQASRADLLGMTTDNGILHLELQSTNDPDMALRMAEYYLHIYRQFRKPPKQIVLYVGEAKLRMSAALREPNFAFQYTLLDFRDLDGAALLESSQIEDNLLAILARLQDQRAAVRQILARIASLDEPARHAAFAQFLIISGLRRLGQTIKEEAQKMPIMNDILDHDCWGQPFCRAGRKAGKKDAKKASKNFFGSNWKGGSGEFPIGPKRVSRACPQPNSMTLRSAFSMPRRLRNCSPPRNISFG